MRCITHLSIEEFVKNDLGNVSGAARPSVYLDSLLQNIRILENEYKWQMWIDYLYICMKKHSHLIWNGFHRREITAWFMANDSNITFEKLVVLFPNSSPRY